ncbi:MAG: LysR family transcriptional regulator [Candidatus Eiseniibacteriota bacterium]
MDRLSSLRIFTKVVEEASFTGAAEKLGLSRALVSKAVIELERDLGARLLERTTRRVKVNEVGAAYYERAQRILGELDEADASVRLLHDAPRGTLRVSAPLSFALLHLKPIVTAYLARNPEVVLSLSLNDRFVDLIDEGFDVAIRISALESSSLVARKIAPARRVLVAAPDYLKKHGTPKTPADLARHRCLPYVAGAAARHEEWRLTGPDGEHVIRATGPLAANNGDMLHCAATDGLGIALLPTFIVGADLQAGKLETVLPDYTPGDFGIYAVYPPNRQLAAKVRVFIDLLVAHFGKRPRWDLVE